MVSKGGWHTIRRGTRKIKNSKKGQKGELRAEKGRLGKIETSKALKHAGAKSCNQGWGKITTKANGGDRKKGNF